MLPNTNSLPISGKADWEMSFDWKGIFELYSGGQKSAEKQTLVRGFCLAIRFLKGFNQLRECRSLWHFLITCRLSDASYSYFRAQKLCKKFYFLGVQSGCYARRSGFLVPRGCARLLCSFYKEGQGLQMHKVRSVKSLCDLKKEKYFAERFFG